MDEFWKVLGRRGWSWEENKRFELALAVTAEEEEPDRWEMVAAMVGGRKTAEDVMTHYVILLEDLLFIESGKLDHQLIGFGVRDPRPLSASSSSSSSSTQTSMYIYVGGVTKINHKLLVQLDQDKSQGHDRKGQDDGSF